MAEHIHVKAETRGPYERADRAAAFIEVCRCGAERYACACAQCKSRGTNNTRWKMPKCDCCNLRHPVTDAYKSKLLHQAFYTNPSPLDKVEIALDILEDIEGNDKVDIAQEYLSQVVHPENVPHSHQWDNYLHTAYVLVRKPLEHHCKLCSDCGKLLCEVSDGP
jgi:hypothetical protein